jgi:hypothetical protein
MLKFIPIIGFLSTPYSMEIREGDVRSRLSVERNTRSGSDPENVESFLLASQRLSEFTILQSFVAGQKVIEVVYLQISVKTPKLKR